MLKKWFRSNPLLNFFFSMMTLLSIQVLFSLVALCKAQERHCTYVPEPPLFHPAIWDYEEVKVVVNDSKLMGVTKMPFYIIGFLTF